MQTCCSLYIPTHILADDCSGRSNFLGKNGWNKHGYVRSHSHNKVQVSFSISTEKAPVWVQLLWHPRKVAHLPAGNFRGPQHSYSREASLITTGKTPETLSNLVYFFLYGREDFFNVSIPKIHPYCSCFRQRFTFLYESWVSIFPHCHRLHSYTFHVCRKMPTL